MVQQTDDNEDGNSHAVSFHYENKSMEHPPLTKNQISLAFDNLSVYLGDKRLLSNVTGYVRRSGMTAVVGVAAAGKSLLLQCLSQRIQAENYLKVTGSIKLFNGKESGSASLKGEIAYVPVEDILLGNLTVRQTLRYAAKLRVPSEPEQERELRIQSIITSLGLLKVADNVVGTVLKRGLSGGEKRRCSVAVELAAQPNILALDEPTSGLDATSAYQSLLAIRSTIQSAATATVGAIIAIQQPNSRLLDLFDDLLILNRNGEAVFFGPVSQSILYFQQLGYPCPENTTPTDYFLHITNTSVSSDETKVDVKQIKVGSIDFAAAYQQSAVYQSMQQDFKQYSVSNPTSSPSIISWFHLYYVLLHRFFYLGTHDITLYYLQFILNTGYGFLVGVMFWQLPLEVSERLQDYSNGIVWIIFVGSYLQVFKVFYLMEMKKRLLHEYQNTTSDYRYRYISAWAAADLTSIIFFNLIFFIPGLLLAFFMMGFPAASAPYLLGMMLLTTIAAESICDFVTQLVRSTPAAIILAQGILVILCVFVDAAFIESPRVESNFWIWLQKLSFFWWASKGINSHIHSNINYSCNAAMVVAQQCSFNGRSYACSSVGIDGNCVISGSTILLGRSGYDTSYFNQWSPAVIVLALLLGARLLTYLFQQYQWTYIRLINRLQLRLIALLKSSPDLSLPSLTTAGSYSASVFRTSNIQLTWAQIKLTLAGKADKLLVDDITGFADAGRVLAILGPSGAGKTTFLNALSVRAPYAEITGKILLREHSGNWERPMLKSDLYYVPQFDNLNPAFTVFQTLCLASKLSSGGDSPECREHVQRLLQILSLEDKSGVNISHLSFGDRKRVSIAMGLIGNPPVLFCDEPTTGLDSEAAASLISYLVKVTRATNVICILTIHQPSAAIFNQLDDLLLLSRGQTVYFGPAHDAPKYFNNYLGIQAPTNSNLADFYLDTISLTPQQYTENNPDHPMNHVDATANWKSMFETYKQSSASVAPTREAKTGNESKDLSASPSEWIRLRLLLNAQLMYNWREKGIYWFRAAELLVIALFVGSLFYQLPLETQQIGNIAGALFFNVWCVLFSSVAAVPVYVRDRISLEDQYLNGSFKAHTFIAAQFIASIPYNFILALVYQSILWFMVGFHNDANAFFLSVLMSCVLMIFMESVALAIVLALKDAMLSTSFAMVILGVLFLFAGFFISQANMVASISWTPWIVPTKYALDSELRAIFNGQNYRQGTSYVAGSQILSTYFHQDSVSQWSYWAVVVAFTIGVRFMYYIQFIMSYRRYKIRSTS